MDALPFEFGPNGAPVPIVATSVNGVDADAVIDSGATGPFPLYVSERLAERLGLQLSREVQPVGDSAVGPGAPTYRVAILGRFTVGGITLDNVEVGVTSVVDGLGGHLGTQVDAIVGQNFLRGRTVAFDYGRCTVEFDALPGDPAAAFPIRFASTKPLLLVDAIIGRGVAAVMEVDTGASASSISPDAARRARLNARGEGVMHGAAGQVTVGFAPMQLRFAGQRRQLPRVAILGAIDGIAESAGARIDGIIGGDMLSGNRLTVDHANGRGWFRPSGPGDCRPRQE